MKAGTVRGFGAEEVQPAPRILTAVPICDGHDTAISTLNLEFARAGIETVYLGYHRSVLDVVRAAIQEDVRGIGLSSYNGGHVEFFTAVVRELRRRGAKDIGVFGGGGGTITPQDARQMQRAGVQRIFFPGTPLSAITEWVSYAMRSPASVSLPSPNGALTERLLAKLLTLAEGKRPLPAGFRIYALGDTSRRMGRGRRAQCLNAGNRGASTRCPVIGITGPGGAGKSTLIDELAWRFLRARPTGRLAILSHDPSAAGRGALLGDRATMVYAQDDRVFMRSLATRSHAGGLAGGTRACLDALRRANFDLVLVETAGIGQEDCPFGGGLVDRQVLVMSPDYGSRIQLQKILMLETADIVVVNKQDRPGARAALAEVEQRLALNHRRPKLLATVANRHRDPGVDTLFAEVSSR